MESFITTVMLDIGTRHRRPEEVQAHTLHIQEAYASLAKNPHFRLVMEDLAQGILLKACKTPEDEGERRLVLKLMKAMETADLAMQRRIDAER